MRTKTSMTKKYYCDSCDRNCYTVLPFGPDKETKHLCFGCLNKSLIIMMQHDIHDIDNVRNYNLRSQVYRLKIEFELESRRPASERQKLYTELLKKLKSIIPESFDSVNDALFSGVGSPHKYVYPRRCIECLKNSDQIIGFVTERSMPHHDICICQNCLIDLNVISFIFAIQENEQL